jgi:hypothetical protein
MICAKTRNLVIPKDADVHRLIVMVEVLFNFSFHWTYREKHTAVPALRSFNKIDPHFVVGGKVQNLFL